MKTTDTLETTILLTVILIVSILFFQGFRNKVETVLESAVTEKSKFTLTVR